MRHSGRQLGELLAAPAGIVEALADCVVVADSDGTVVYANPACGTMLGWSPDELVGQPVSGLVPSRLRPAHERAFAAYVATGERRILGRPVRLPALRRDGTEVPMDVLLSGRSTGEGEHYVLASMRAVADDDRAAEASLAQQLLAVLAERLTRDEMLPRVLDAIGTSLGWDVATVWVREPAADQLRTDAHWNRVPADRFEAASRASLFPPGVGLPGRVWESARTEAIEDLAADPGFLRRDPALASGLRSGMAFPLTSGGRFAGVIELYSVERRSPTPDLVRTLAGLGELLGTFLDRSQVEEERHRLLAQVQTERAQLEAVVRQLPQGVVIVDHAGRVVLTNDAADRLIGSHQPGEEISLARPDGVAYLPEVLPLARSLASAQPAATEEFPVRLADGESGILALTCTPVWDRTGRRVSSVVVTVEDVTERKREQLRLQLLAEAGEILARSLDVEETLRAIVRLSVPAFVDVCLANLVDEQGEVVRVGARAADPEREQLLLHLLDSFEPSSLDAGLPLAIRSGEAVVYDEISDELLAAAATSDEHLDLLRRLGPRSAVIAPMVGRGRTIGALTFAVLAPNRRLSDKDAELAMELGRRSGLAVANARLYEHEKAIATELQRSLLPPSLPEIPGLELASEFHAGLEGQVVGGDFFDAFPCGDGAWALLIGDVCGKGSEAAVVAGRVRYSARAIAEGMPGPELAARLNQLVLTEHPDRFCTMAFAVLRPAGPSVRATVVCAGHPAPVLVHQGGRVEPIACQGSLLGVLSEVEHREVEVTLAPGQSLVMYTDGVVEARRDGKFFGSEGVARALSGVADRPAAEQARTLALAAVEHAGGIVQDDIAVLVARSAAGLR